MLEAEPTPKSGRLRPYLSVREAADLLRTTRRAIYSLIDRGRLGGAVVRLGRRILLKRKALVALLEDSHR